MYVYIYFFYETHLSCLNFINTDRLFVLKQSKGIYMPIFCPSAFDKKETKGRKIKKCYPERVFFFMCLREKNL